LGKAETCKEAIYRFVEFVEDNLHKVNNIPPESEDDLTEMKKSFKKSKVYSNKIDRRLRAFISFVNYKDELQIDRDLNVHFIWLLVK